MRRHTNFSQESLAEALGVSQSTLADAEGKNGYELVLPQTLQLAIRGLLTQQALRAFPGGVEAGVAWWMGEEKPAVEFGPGRFVTLEAEVPEHVG